MLKVSFDKQIVIDWYNREDVYNLIYNSTRFKYVTFMKYKEDGTTYPPRRFQTLGDKYDGFKWLLKFNKIGIMPTSMYRDVDNWSKRKFFDNHFSKYKVEREEFFKDLNYRQYQMNPDFVIDVDGEDMYDAWNSAYAIADLFKQFNVMFFILPSGKKGWQLVVPGYKAIKRTYFIENGKEYNTHQCLLINIKEYLGLGVEIDECTTDDLRFVKQPFALDGRNMYPLVPMRWEEFLTYKDYKDKPKSNPFISVDYWQDVNLTKRGFCWQGSDNMNRLDYFLDEWVDKQ